MISLPLFQTVNQATFWTYRAKDVAARNDIRRLDLEREEMHWYREAAILVYELFVAMTHEATTHQYEKDRADICSKLASPVENMIHRLYYLQQLEYLSPEQQAALKEIQFSLQQVSDYILPIACPLPDMHLGKLSKPPNQNNVTKEIPTFSKAVFAYVQQQESDAPHHPATPPDRPVYEGGCLFQVVIGLLVAGALSFLLFIR